MVDRTRDFETLELALFHLTRSLNERFTISSDRRRILTPTKAYLLEETPDGLYYWEVIGREA